MPQLGAGNGARMRRLRTVAERRLDALEERGYLDPIRLCFVRQTALYSRMPTAVKPRRFAPL
jgi:hypothetical protein